MNKKWYKHCVMFFSFKERRARKLARYRQRVSEIANMESDEKDFEYITLKTDYEHKKRALTIFAIFLVLVILPNVWKYFFLYIERGTYEKKKNDILIIIYHCILAIIGWELGKWLFF